MSRVRELIIKNDQQCKVYKVMQIMERKIVLCDLWVLQKYRSITKALYPILQIAHLMLFNIGLLLIYGILHANLVTPAQKQPCIYANSNRETDGPLGNNVGLPDFASEVAGGSVRATPDTHPFYHAQEKQLTIFGIPIWRATYFSPRKVIQPWIQAGECWAFRGSYGKIEIELAYTIIISNVTIEHIPITASLTGTIDSAPKEFAVYGIYRETYVTIGRFTYDINNSSSQTFKVDKTELKYIPFKYVLLEILSNWGNPQFTCIYRFKVHGKIFSAS